MTKTGQRQRILDRLAQGGIIPMPELSRVGSGRENGWCNSFTRRISEIRQMGHVVICTKTKQADSTIQTAYELKA